jgi:hypothetical protein
VKKAELQAQLGSMGLPVEGTVKELKARLAGGVEKPLVTVGKAKAKGKVADDRKSYRMRRHLPK